MSSWRIKHENQDFTYYSATLGSELKCGLPLELFLRLRLRINAVCPFLFPLAHELVKPVNESHHLFLSLVWRKDYAHCHVDVLTRRRGKKSTSSTPSGFFPL